jgi:hypothetical protein
LSATSALRKALQASLWPHAERAGFARGKSTSLFTTFRRQAGDVVHVFDVQWDKYHRPRFVINFGAASLSGLLQKNQVAGVEGIEPHHCPDMLRLHRRHGGSMNSWFQLRRPLWEKVTTLSWNHSPDEVATTVVSLFPELEAWWATRAVGPHVRLLLSRPGP